MAVSDEVRVGVAGSHDRKRTHGDIKLVIAIIAILDLVAILIAEILAWDLRMGFDVWFDTPLGGQQAITDAITHAPPRSTARSFGQGTGRPTTQEAHA